MRQSLSFTSANPLDTLIVGAGALGGILAARLLQAGAAPVLAVRNPEAAERLRLSGIRAVWDDHETHDRDFEVLAFDDLPASRRFDIVILATKAHDALALAPGIASRLTQEGVVLPLQNGAFAGVLDERLSAGCVLGAISNLAATMIEPGSYVRGNRGQLVIGELAGGLSSRVEAVAEYLRPACDIDVTSNFAGSVWSKLALNCSVTTLGAIAGCTLSEYMRYPSGLAAFTGLYDEVIAVAAAESVRLEVLKVPAERPGSAQLPADAAQERAWIDAVSGFYGTLRASMLQDLERGRKTEVKYQNGYVASIGARHGLDVSLNRRAVEIVEGLESAQSGGRRELLDVLLGSSVSRGSAPN